MNLSFDPKTTAVLSLDLQAGVVAAYLKDDDSLLQRAERVLSGARRAGMLVVHVRLAFRPGCPEISENNALLVRIKRSAQHQRLFDREAGDIHPVLTPLPGDVVVTKSRVSAFAGTDLDLILRASNVRSLVLFGIATSGVVLSTLLEATDRDYQVAIVEDCCADADSELHDCLAGKLFPQRATVLTSKDFLKEQDEGKL
jgi:nicotinamidase-related amidase